jgi:uncharacterized protein (TIGR02246 family)
MPFHLRGNLVVTPEQAQSIILQAKTAWLSGDAQAFVQLFSPNGKFIVPGKVWQGPSAIHQAFDKFADAYRVKTIDIKNLVLQNNHAFVEWYWEEQERETGRVSPAEDAIAIDFQGDRILRWREYIDSDSPRG